MPRIVAALMRHSTYGQPQDVPSAHLPYPLDEAGRKLAKQEAEKIATKAAERGWSVDTTIDCSRMLRAWETAGIVGAALSKATGHEFRVAQFDELAERGLGCAANLTTGQIESIIAADPRFESLPPDWKRRSDFRLPLQGAESMNEAGVRTAQHIVHRTDSIGDAAEAGDSAILKLFVGHGAAFRHAAAELGTMERNDIAKYSMHHCRPVYLERLGSGEWRHIDGDWKRRDTEAHRD
jgi:broad specificity phosphatase PhoE